DEIGFDGDLPTGLLIQQHAGTETRRLQVIDQIGNKLQGFACVQNVINQEHLTACNVECQAVNELRISDRFCPGAVTGNADTIEAYRIVDFAHQVGRKHDCAVD